MPTLIQFLVAHTQATAQRLQRRHQLVSGVVVRRDGAGFLVNIGDRSVYASPGIATPLLPGDRVWVRYGFGAPLIIGTQGRDAEVTDG